MIELRILRGGPAVGDSKTFHKLPFSVGRARADWVLVAKGVWERHFEIIEASDEQLEIVCHAESSVMVNGTRAQRARVRPGDVLQVGELEIGFGFSPPELHSQLLWECFVGLGVGFIALTEVALAMCWRS